MKINVIGLIFVSLLATSCSNEREKEIIEVIEVQTELDTIVTIQDTPVYKELNTISLRDQQESVLGYYVGDFEAVTYTSDKNPTLVNKISIVIDSLVGSSIYGHSIVAGNNQVFSGAITEEDKAVIEFEGKEPGNNKYDGVFKAKLNKDNKIIVGVWESYNKSLAVTKRSFKLEKKVFSYDPSIELPRDVEWSQLYNGEHFDEEVGEWESTTDAVLTINPSKALLKKEDVENLYQGDLEVLRNSIYARHGYSFKHRRMRYVFDKVDWYIPVSADIRLALTDIEKKNIDLIKRYEKHANAYYDSYGR